MVSYVAGAKVPDDIYVDMPLDVVLDDVTDAVTRFKFKPAFLYGMVSQDSALRHKEPLRAGVH